MPRSVRVGPSSVNGIPHPRCARTHLRRAVDPGASADPEGLTAGVRPRARPYERAAAVRICPAPYAKREYVGLPCRVASSARAHQYEIA
jgi:hypothetical protein